MHISYQPLWNALKERGMRKEDLRLAAGLTTNMIANMGKGKHISMETLLRISSSAGVVSGALSMSFSWALRISTSMLVVKVR